jgi:RND family efflux transporter MFP subunit
MRKPHLRTITLLLVLTAIAGCGKSTKTDNAIEPINVKVVKVAPAGESETLTLSGTIEESESIPLSFSMPGTVAQVNVVEGQSVKKGQLLASLENTSSLNAYNVALASLKQAEDAIKRLTPMYKNGTIPEIKYVEVQTGVDQARAGAAIAKKNLDDCKLYATTDGYIGKRTIDPGMVAMPGISSIKIVKIGKVFARVSIPENNIAFVTRGQHASITVGALGADAFTGTVEEIGVVADPLAHTYAVKIAIQNAAMKIRPGMICTAMLEAKRTQTGLCIPANAVISDDAGIPFVYVVENNCAEQRTVKTGRLMNSRVEVLEGLKGDETIVTAGQHKLFPHAPIHIVAQ